MGPDNQPSVLYHGASPSTSTHHPRSSFSDSSAHCRTLSTVTRTSVSTEAALQQPLLTHNRSSTISGSTAESTSRLAKRRKHLKKGKKKKKGSTMAEKERKLLTTFWNDEPSPDSPSSRRSPSRLLSVVKVITEAVLGIWALYGAVRYLYTYGTVEENHTIPLALGICSALAASFIIAACILSTALSRYLQEEGVSRPALRLLRLSLRNLAAVLLLAPALTNFALVIVWRNSEGERCHLDVDVVWFLRTGNCNPRAFGVWLGLAVLRLVLTLMLLVLYILLSYQRHSRPDGKAVEGVAGSVNISPETRATRHRSDLSQSTYQSSSGRPLSTGSEPPLTTPPMGVHKHSSSRVSRPFSPLTLSQQDVNETESGTAITPSQLDFTNRASSPPGLHSIPEGFGTAGPSRASPTIDEQQLNAFAEQFRSLVAKITRDTAEGLNLDSPSTSPNLPRTRSRIRSHPPSAPSSGSATPHAYPRGGAMPAIPHPFSSSYTEAEEYNPYERDPSYDSDSSGEEDMYLPLAGVPGARYTFAPGFGDPVPYSALPGTQQQQQEHVRILGSYVRRMSTIESMGSRERMSMYSTNSFGALRDRGYDSSASDAGGIGTLGRVGGEGRTQSLRSVGLASLASASMSFTGSASAQGSVAGTRPPTRTGTLASVTTENISGLSRSSTSGSHPQAHLSSSAAPSPSSLDAPPLPTPSVRSLASPWTAENVLVEETSTSSASNSYHSLLEAADTPSSRPTLDTSSPSPTAMVADRLNDSPIEVESKTATSSTAT